MKLACLMAVAAAVAGLPALAEPVGGKAADDMLFGVRGSSVAVAQDLSEVEQVILRKVIELSETQMNQPLRYYASIAFSPDDGLTQEPGPISSANHHGVAAADAAALAACDAKRRAGTRPCRIGARVVPRGYAPCLWAPRPPTARPTARRAARRRWRFRPRPGNSRWRPGPGRRQRRWRSAMQRLGAQMIALSRSPIDLCQSVDLTGLVFCLGRIDSANEM